MKYITPLLACLCSFPTMSTNAQPSDSLAPSKYFYQFTRVLLTNGTAREGWFLGTQRDSVVIQIGRMSERFSRKDLLRVIIDTKPERSEGLLAGLLAGIYAGNALFLNDEDQPFLFLGDEYGDGGPVWLYNVLFAAVGGGIGYLVASIQSDELVFDFTGTEEEHASRWAELCESGIREQRKEKVHVSFQPSWVSGPIPHADSRYEIKHTSDLNMLRKLQLTYTLADFAEVGLAFMWVGQPELYSFNGFDPYVRTRARLNGNGYYAIGVFQPLWNLKLRVVQWDVGLGVGAASVSFSAAREWHSYESGPSIIAVEKSAKCFSALACTEFRFLITHNFSVGLAADIVYIPEPVPEVQGIGFESTQMGTSSVGIVFGMHL